MRKTPTTAWWLSGESEALIAALSSSNPKSHDPLERKVWIVLLVESGPQK